MNELTTTSIIAIVSLIFIFILLVLLAILKAITIELESKIEDLEHKVSELYKENLSLKYDIRFEKTISKTFSDGLEALTNKNKQ